MAAPPTSDAAASDPQAPLTADELAEALKVEVFDRDGKAATLEELVKGKRTALIFIRHFCKFRYLAISLKDKADIVRVLELSSIREVHEQVRTTSKFVC